MTLYQRSIVIMGISRTVFVEINGHSVVKRKLSLRLLFNVSVEEFYDDIWGQETACNHRTKSHSSNSENAYIEIADLIVALNLTLTWE